MAEEVLESGICSWGCGGGGKTVESVHSKARRLYVKEEGTSEFCSRLLLLSPCQCGFARLGVLWASLPGLVFRSRIVFW